MADRAPPARSGVPSRPPEPPAGSAAARTVVEAKLVCRAGPSAGEEFPLTGQPQVVGRAADVEIPIPDTSVSRRHLRISKRLGAWMVADLGSGNGTLVNGERVDAETPLHHGDVLTLGDTELTFTDVANVTDKAPIPAFRPSSGRVPRPSPSSRSGSRPRPSRYRHQVTAPPSSRRNRSVKVLLVCLFAAGVAVLVGVKRLAEQRNRIQAQVEASRQKKSQALAQIYQEATRLAADGDWKAAEAKYQQVAAQDASYEDIKARLERAQKEIPNQEALAEAQDRLDAGHLGEAAAALGKVTPDTFMFRQVAHLKEALQAKAVTQLQAIQAALDAHKPREALALADDVLAAVPDQRDAKALREQAEALVKNPHAHLRAHAAAAGSEAVSRFVRGDLTGALAEANACAPHAPRCRVLARELAEFSELRKRVDSLDSAGLARLRELEQDISGGQGSTLATGAGSKQAGVLYKKALAAKARGDLGAAALYAKQANEADGKLAGAKALLAELRQQAKQVFLDGYSETDTNPADALVKFKTVLNMTAPGDEYHEKAQRWIEKLRQ